MTRTHKTMAEAKAKKKVLYADSTAKTTPPHRSNKTKDLDLNSRREREGEIRKEIGEGHGNPHREFARWSATREVA